jgi:hypothetical protein
VQLSQGRKADVGLRLGLHARPPPETSQRIKGSHRRIVLAASQPLNHSALPTRYTGSTIPAPCDSSHRQT